MPTLTGNWAPSSTANARMRLRLVYAVTTTATQATITGDLYVDAGYRFVDANNNLSWSGALGSGSTSASIDVPSGGSQKLRTLTRTIALTAQQQSLTFSASLSGVEYVGATARLSGSVVVPSGTPAAPTPASSLTASYERLSRIVLSWAGSSPGQWEIQQWSAATGRWARIALVDGTARSRLVANATADQRYQWRIRAVTGSQTSSWTTSSYVRTAPAPATNVHLERTDTSNFLASWQVNSTLASTQRIELQSTRADGTWGEWSTLVDDLHISVSTRAIAASTLALGRQHRIRIVTGTTTEVPSTLWAYSSPSGSLQPLTAPSAPTLRSPVGTTVESGDVRFAWSHNPVDTTKQTAFELRYRPVGAVEWVTIEGTTAASVVASITDAGPVEWQVRTKGMHADWSPWSTLARFTAAEPPAITIMEPADGSVVHSTALDMTIAYADPQSARLTSWAVEVTNADGHQLAYRRFSSSLPSGGTATTHLSGMAVNNGDVLTVRVTGQSGTGLTAAPAVSTLTIDFLPPPAPPIEATWIDETAQVSLAIIDIPVGAWGAAVGTWEAATETWGDAFTNLPAAVSGRIERSLDGGRTWEVIADDLPPGAGHLDWAVPLGVEAQYRAAAISALGVEAIGAPTSIRTGACHVMLTAADGSEWVALEYNLSFSHTQGHTVEFAQYLGAERPTAHFGEALPESVAISGVLIREDRHESMADLASMLRRPVWYRDPEGRAFWASITSDIGSSQSLWSKRDISLSVTRIERPDGVVWP